MDKGFARLREAGSVGGVWPAGGRSQYLNEAFANYIRRQTPLVTLKTAMTLDGKIAPPPGESENPTALGAASASGGWITSEVARAHVQELRHQNDAILVGVGTDHCRRPPAHRPQRPSAAPAACCASSWTPACACPWNRGVVKTGQRRCAGLCSFAEEKRKQTSAGTRHPRGAVPGGHARTAGPIWRASSVLLGELEITSLLIEGGAMINWAALHSGIVDKVFLYYAPKILAGTGSVPFATASGFSG